MCTFNLVNIYNDLINIFFGKYNKKVSFIYSQFSKLTILSLYIILINALYWRIFISFSFNDFY